MTSGPRSRRGTCARFRSGFDRPEGQVGLGPFCAAFPRIILRNDIEQCQPIDGDHGLRWEPTEGEELPEWALLPGGPDRALVGLAGGG
jgi:hypothetical protein